VKEADVGIGTKNSLKKTKFSKGFGGVTKLIEISLAGADI
jgi:hypothetical protein